MSTYAGIDLGSLYSAVAVVASDDAPDAVPNVVANDDGDHQIPTFFADIGHEELFGQPARAIGVRKPKNSFSSFHKYLVVAPGESIPREANLTMEDEEMKQPHYAVPIPVLNEDGDEVDTNVRRVTPRQATAKYIARLREWALNSSAGKPLETAVVAVSANSSEEYKKELQEALHEAGFKSTHVIEEPVAATLAFDRNIPKAKRTGVSLVVDFGARHFDVSVVARAHGVYSVVKSVSDSTLGGKAIDEALFGYICQQFHRKTRLNVAEERRPSAKLRLACEQTKRGLSRSATAMLSIEALMDGVDFNESVPIQRFELLIQNTVQSCIKVMNDTITSAGLVQSDIDSILLVGGSSRVPLFQSEITKAFPAIPVRKDVEPDEAIAIGCALQARDLTKAGFEEAAKKTHSVPYIKNHVGLKNAAGGFTPIFPRLSGLPAHKTVVMSVAKTGNNTDIYIPLHEGDEKSEAGKLVAEIVLSNVIDDAMREEGKTTVSFTLTPEGDLYVHVHHKPIEEGVKINILA